MGGKEKANAGQCCTVMRKYENDVHKFSKVRNSKFEFFTNYSVNQTYLERQGTIISFVVSEKEGDFRIIRNEMRGRGCYTLVRDIEKIAYEGLLK